MSAQESLSDWNDRESEKDKHRGERKSEDDVAQQLQEQEELSEKDNSNESNNSDEKSNSATTGNMLQGNYINTVLFGPGTKASKKKESNGTILAILGLGTAKASAKMFNNNTWYNLEAGRSYSQKYYGNKYQSAEDISAAKGLSRNVSRGLKVFGFGIGLWSQYNILSDNKMSTGQKEIETGSNFISTFGGVYGAAWGIGWEVGRTITQIPWYRQNIRPLLQDLQGIPRDEVPKSSTEFDKYYQ